MRSEGNGGDHEHVKKEYGDAYTANCPDVMDLILLFRICYFKTAVSAYSPVQSYDAAWYRDERYGRALGFQS